MQYFKKLFAITLLLFATSLGAYSATISTDAKLQFNKGVDYYKLGQLENAVSCFKNAIDLDPNYIDAYYNLGTLLEYLNQKEAALSIFNQIILRKPDDYEAIYKAAQINLEIGETEKAQKYLSQIPKDSSLNTVAKKLSDSINNNSQKIETKNDNNAENELNTIPKKNSAIGVFAEIQSPTGIVTDKTGNIYIGGYLDNTIYKINSSNEKKVYLKDTKIDGPIGLVMDNMENLYIANYNKDNVLKVDKLGKITVFIKDISKPYCMHISNGYLYVSAQGSNSVIKQKI